MVRNMTDRSTRLANRGFRKQENLERYLAQRAARSARRNNWGRDSEVVETYFHNTQHRRVYKMGGTQATYGSRLLSAATSFWRGIPEGWKKEGVNIYLKYDFLPSSTHGRPEWGLTQKTFTRREGQSATRQEELVDYENHFMTRLSSPEGEGAEGVSKMKQFTDTVRAHIFNRMQLEEKYDILETNIFGDQVPPEYYTPNHVSFTCHRRRLDTEESMGDRHTNLFKKYLTSNNSDGDCVWRLIKTQMQTTEYPIKDTIDEMIQKTGLQKRVSLEDLDIIEAKIKITHGKKRVLASPFGIGLVIFDGRLNLRRLPLYPEVKTKSKKQKKFIYGVMHNLHAYGIASDRVASAALARDLSYYEAFLKAAAWPNTVDDCYKEAWALFRECQHMQPDRQAIRDYILKKLDLGPDCIDRRHVDKHKIQYIPWSEIEGQNEMLTAWMKTEGLKIWQGNKYGNFMTYGYRYNATWYRAIKSIGKAGFVAKASDAYYVHGVGEVVLQILQENAPWDTLKPMKRVQYIPPIEAKGLNIRCQELNIDKSDMNKRARLKEQIEKEIILPKVTYDMDQTLSMDLETGSVVGTGGTFLVYAVGYRYKGKRTSLVAQSSEDLNGGILWRALLAWDQIAAEISVAENEGGSGDTKTLPLYVYAHNGSRFDAIPSIHTILSKCGEVPTDQLESNGKFISFKWRNLIFRDSCLITMSSLSAACNAFSLKTSKGYFPHRYLQNCHSEAELLNRLHGRVKWRDLEIYMDWFSDCTDQELHTRVYNKTHDEWRKEQPVYKFWYDNCDEEITVKDFMLEYLGKDVDALWELCEVLGHAFARDLGADIRQKCTLGSCAEHMWQYTLLQPIPKLETFEEHQQWQRTNRGGFCGPLSYLDYTAPDGTDLYKDDLTSQYPACTMKIQYTTSTGGKEPLKGYYKGFPNPKKGWERYDFAGDYMTDAHCEFLAELHGDIRIEFDQSSLKFPFFTKKMQHKQFGTLAFVRKGGDRFIIPQIRMAYDLGVKIRLFDACFTFDSWEPYNAYMNLYKEKKNAADRVIKTLEEKHGCVNKTFKPDSEQYPQAECDEDRSKYQKAVYDRTIAKLFLNALLGRNNMKIDRKQTMITRSFNDIVNLCCDDSSYSSVDVQEITCGENTFFRAGFKEGDYQDHIKQFNVVPYLTAYMLGYSKMLMQASFQFITAAGGLVLYTDTDSLVARMSKEQRQAYKDEFIPLKKTFGGMAEEGVYKRFVSVGPKKYICIEENHCYDWHCNGLPARHNTELDVLGTFEKVLAGEVQTVDHFSINAMTNFELRHTLQDCSKQMRFLALKGAVENDTGEVKDQRIRFWNDEREFIEYCGKIQMIGETARGCNPPPSSAEILADFDGWDERRPIGDFERDIMAMNHDDDERLPTLPPSKIPKKPAVAATRPSYVYVLTDMCGQGDHYTGFTVDLEKRLSKHNDGSGAAATKHTQWKYWKVYEGFKNEGEALSFEARIKTQEANDLSHLENLFQQELNCPRWGHISQVDMIIPQSWVKNEASAIHRKGRGYGELYIYEFIRYYELAQKNGSRSYPIRASATKKQPIDKHAVEGYDVVCGNMVRDMKQNGARWAEMASRAEWNMNLLIDDLYIIDLDTAEAIEFFDTSIRPNFEEELSTCPLQKTKKGFHYFFVRPKGCKHYNGARAYKIGEKPLQIDCCTVTATGTRGNISVYPSKNKEWIRSIHECPPQVMSDKLYTFLDGMYIGKRTKSQSQRVAGASRVQLSAEHQYWSEYISKASGCPPKAITWQTPTQGRVQTANRRCLADASHTAEHDNAFLCILQDGDLQYHCLSARCKKTTIIKRSGGNCTMCNTQSNSKERLLYDGNTTEFLNTFAYEGKSLADPTAAVKFKTSPESDMQSDVPESSVQSCIDVEPPHMTRFRESISKQKLAPKRKFQEPSQEDTKVIGGLSFNYERPKPMLLSMDKMRSLRDSMPDY